MGCPCFRAGQPTTFLDIDEAPHDVFRWPETIRVESSTRTDTAMLYQFLVGLFVLWLVQPWTWAAGHLDRKNDTKNLATVGYIGAFICWSIGIITWLVAYRSKAGDPASHFESLFTFGVCAGVLTGLAAEFVWSGVGILLWGVMVKARESWVQITTPNRLQTILRVTRLKRTYAQAKKTQERLGASASETFNLSINEIEQQLQKVRAERDEALEARRQVVDSQIDQLWKVIRNPYRAYKNAQIAAVQRNAKAVEARTIAQVNQTLAQDRGEVASEATLPRPAKAPEADEANLPRISCQG